MSSDKVSRPNEKDTRRKFLAGSAILHKAENEPEYKKRLLHQLNSFLERDDDRALFDLPPRPRTDAKTAEQKAEEPAEQ